MPAWKRAWQGALGVEAALAFGAAAAFFALVGVTVAVVDSQFLAVAVLIGQLAAYSVRRAARSEARVARLADEQTALRQVATLVARGVPPPEVFAAVAREAGRLLGVDAIHLGGDEG